MKVAVITFPGSNCDYDLYKAIQMVDGEASFVWHRDRGLRGYDAVMLPGGFSYGDYLRPGAIARMSPVMEEVMDFAAKGGPVLGICNGFQILCEAGLLPGALMPNRSLKFQSKDVFVRVERADTLFTADYDAGAVLRIPIAHHDGNFEADQETLRRLEDDGRVVFRYVDRSGEPTDESNPNGSWHNIAGIVNDGGNVLGMMPHPERAMEPILGSTDGRGLFTSILRSLTPA
ncbi:MAG: phosphoribosylformylglycinamidine synthase subunit PurQ [Gemmatimonadota bacterium]|nr:phosphoribosylformylglycinamidine synthase subunit PurQ [Gemmatimonadota bacterium]MDH5758382.1 phosphoribosylformylglycinamidine synthase subunit PurQ [Gemmatimonadota bacterium]